MANCVFSTGTRFSEGPFRGNDGGHFGNDGFNWRYLVDSYKLFAFSPRIFIPAVFWFILATWKGAWWKYVCQHALPFSFELQGNGFEDSWNEVSVQNQEQHMDAAMDSFMATGTGGGRICRSRQVGTKLHDGNFDIPFECAVIV